MGLRHCSFTWETWMLEIWHLPMFVQLLCFTSNDPDSLGLPAAQVMTTGLYPRI